MKAVHRISRWFFGYNKGYAGREWRWVSILMTGKSPNRKGRFKYADIPAKLFWELEFWFRKKGYFG